MSDNFDDMQIVEELLIEYSRCNDPYDEDADIDDSSEQDKDFLFGALLHKFGEILRREYVFSTIYLYFRGKKGIKHRSYNFLFSKYFSVVADTFVVLNFGLNHLLQFLYYEATGNLSHLTSKGMANKMLVVQDEILTKSTEIRHERGPINIQTNELERIIWLSKFCQDPIQIKEQSNNRYRNIFIGSVSLGATYLVSLAIMNSYNYHPTYLAIIEKEKQEIAGAIETNQEKIRKVK